MWRAARSAAALRETRSPTRSAATSRAPSFSRWLQRPTRRRVAKASGANCRRIGSCRTYAIEGETYEKYNEIHRRFDRLRAPRGKRRRADALRLQRRRPHGEDRRGGEEGRHAHDVHHLRGEGPADADQALRNEVRRQGQHLARGNGQGAAANARRGGGEEIG